MTLDLDTKLMRKIQHECQSLHIYNEYKDGIDSAINFFERFQGDFGNTLSIDDYPSIRHEGDLIRFLDFVNLLKRFRLYLSSNPSQLIIGFKRSLDMGVSTNACCLKGCLDCVSDSKTEGIQVPFIDLTGFSDKFYSGVKVMRFGLEGEPLIYSHSGNNLGDLIEFYLNKGIDKFTLSTGCPIQTPLVKNTLEKICNLFDSTHEFYPRLTYSFYPVGNNFDKITQNDEEFINILKSLLPVSSIMNVQVRGDFFYKETNIDEVTKHFDELMQENGFRREVPLTVNSKTTEYFYDKMKINAYTSTFVYLSERLKRSIREGILTPSKPYESREVETGHICHHIFNYDSFVIMPNGDVRLCNMINSYVDPKPFVRNIYSGGGEEKLFRKLTEYNTRCISYFLNNFRDIMFGNKPTCLCNLEIYSEAESA